jgi:hypothetical protein
MTLIEIISSIDSEIACLTQVRVLLSTDGNQIAAAPVRKRRKMSAAARKRIGAAQRKRWAKQKAAVNK